MRGERRKVAGHRAAAAGSAKRADASPLSPYSSPAKARKAINVGLLGIGIVGGGTFAVLARNQEEIARRAGCAITMNMVAD